MTDGDDDIIARLQAAAAVASRAEDDYRRDHADRLRLLERNRVFAFRRAGLVGDLVEAVIGAPDGDAAVAAGEALLRREFGLTREREGHRLVLDRFVPVSEALDLALNGEGEERLGAEAVLSALAAFETWYEGHSGTPFMALFDTYVQQTPVVDF